MGRRKNFTGQSFWARGYHVSTVGRDEAMIREYIKNQTEPTLYYINSTIILRFAKTVEHIFVSLATFVV